MKICIFDKYMYVTTRHATFAYMLVTVYANLLENTRKHQNSASWTINKLILLAFTTNRNISRGCAKKLEFPEGSGGVFCGLILENPGGSGGGGGAYEKSLPWVGYGYFLEPHNSASPFEIQMVATWYASSPNFSVSATVEPRLRLPRHYDHIFVPQTNGTSGPFLSFTTLSIRLPCSYEYNSHAK